MSHTSFFLNLQGEGVQSLRKGVCANHIRDVSNLFTGAHLTVNARLEDEVEKDKIIQKVSSVGSAYSFKEQRTINEGPKIPVGTAYSRVNAAKEINPTERSKFWERTEEEEKRRVNSEKDLKKQEFLKADQVISFFNRFFLFNLLYLINFVIYRKEKYEKKKNILKENVVLLLKLRQ